MKTLIVEDDFTSRLLLQTLMNPYGEVHVAVNGKEALVAFKAALDIDKPYDVVCLDIMMPEMDGQTALKEIREIEREAKIAGLNRTKIIMTTALDDPQNILNAFNEQCEAYIIKPIKKDKLFEQLRSLGQILS